MHATRLDLPAEKSILDAIAFVASLVSKSSDVDPQLDRVRAITAQRTVKEFTVADKDTLDEVYAYLEDYLVTKDALRSFTRESLRKKLYENLSGEHHATSIQPIAAVWGVAIVSTILAMLMPDFLVAPNLKPTLAITVFLACINIGAAWMFWSGLANFKDKIRRAYLPICIGIALVGVTMLEIPIAIGLGEDDSIGFRYIISSLSIPIAETLFYIGMS